MFILFAQPGPARPAWPGLSLACPAQPGPAWPSPSQPNPARPGSCKGLTKLFKYFIKIRAIVPHYIWGRAISFVNQSRGFNNRTI